MVSFRTVVPFNGPFSSHLSASGFDVVNCGPSHTATCPSCYLWQSLATLHSALCSQPDIKQEASAQQYRVVLELDFLTPAICTFLSPLPLEKTQCRQWSSGENITLCHTILAAFHKYIQLNASLVQTRKHFAHITTVKADKLFPVCHVDSTTAIKLLSVLAQTASSIIFNCQRVVLNHSSAAEE